MTDLDEAIDDRREPGRLIDEQSVEKADGHELFQKARNPSLQLLPFQEKNDHRPREVDDGKKAEQLIRIAERS